MSDKSTEQAVREGLFQEFLRVQTGELTIYQAIDKILVCSKIYSHYGGFAGKVLGEQIDELTNQLQQATSEAASLRKRIKELHDRNDQWISEAVSYREALADILNNACEEKEYDFYHNESTTDDACQCGSCKIARLARKYISQPSPSHDRWRGMKVVVEAAKECMADYLNVEKQCKLSMALGELDKEQGTDKAD